MISKAGRGARGKTTGPPPALPTQLQPFSRGVSKSERALVAGTNGSVDEVESNITAAVRTFGLAPGAKKMMDAEKLAAEEAIQSGLYGIWRNASTGHDFCSRIGPISLCFCGHNLSEHEWDKARRKLRPSCTSCPCSGFSYMPRRPEEVGEWWLPRRRGFDVRLWRAKCKCGHAHEDHDPCSRSCQQCGCKSFASSWLCTACEGRWEDHESLWETEQERRAVGRPVGQAFFPLASTPELQDLAFAPGQQHPCALPHRPRPERSVKLMRERCSNYGGGGAAGAKLSSSSSSMSRGLAVGSAESAGLRDWHTSSLEDAFPPARGAHGVRP